MTDQTTAPLDLDAIQALADAATERPWKAGEEIDGFNAGRRTVVRTSQTRIVTVGQTRPHDHRNAGANVAFIVAVANAWPALSAELRCLRAELTDLRERFAALAVCEEYIGESCGNASHNIRRALSGEYDPRPDADQWLLEYRTGGEPR